MNREIEVTKVNNFLLYLIVGLVPLILIPVNGTLETAWTKLLFLLVISMFFIYLPIRKPNEITFIEKTIENRFLVGYVILVLISLFFSSDPFISVIGSGYRHDGFISLIVYCFAYLIARNAKSIEKWFFSIIFVTSVLVAIYGILQFYNLDPIPKELYRTEWVSIAFSTMGNPNFLGSYLVLSIPIPLYLYFYKNKKTGLLAYSILFLALLATNTRGSWIGAFIALISFLILHKMKSGFNKSERKKVIIVFLTSILMILFFTLTTGDALVWRFLSIFGDFSSIIKDEETAQMAGSYRVFIWEKVIELIRMKPWFGWGVDTLYIPMETYYKEDVISLLGYYLIFDKAHNEYLNIAVSSGIPSLIVYLGFIFFALKKGLQKMTKHEAYVPLLAAIIGYLVQALFNIQMVMVYYIFFAYLGIVTSKGAFVKENNAEIGSSSYLL